MVQSRAMLCCPVHALHGLIHTGQLILLIRCPALRCTVLCWPLLHFSAPCCSSCCLPAVLSLSCAEYYLTHINVRTCFPISCLPHSHNLPAQTPQVSCVTVSVSPPCMPHLCLSQFFCPQPQVCLGGSLRWGASLGVTTTWQLQWWVAVPINSTGILDVKLVF